jgi:propionyl-CoA carboxylase alpha chain
MISKLLVANRGEIAVRVFETAAKMGISTVAVYSDPDREAVFTRAADEAVAIGGSSPAESYLRGDAIIEAALKAGASAIHPGYGFLSENAAFARAVLDAGLVWVGPPPDAIEVMGSKLASKELVARAGVPTLPSIDVTAGGAADAALQIGYPVLIKASAGGGGKGMRIVRDPSSLESAVAGAKREAGSAFGDDTVFLEKYLEAPRHIEIQVFADHTGRAISLFERECSIQRRHQKIIEESPSPAIDAELRERMGAAAVDAAAAVGYVGAGTVEFLFLEGDFWFLEMNTRLQVEHPVTEMVTGLDLVELQLLTAMGEDLPPAAWTPSVSGHAIEARLYAEDPLNDYLPVTGKLIDFRVPDSVRTDSGVTAGSVVSVHYDPMLAKVIAHGDDRASAARLLALALRRSVVAGMTTNRELLVGILEHPEFMSGAIDTHFLERHDPVALANPLLMAAELHGAAVVAALDASVRRRSAARVLRSIPSGWRNNPSSMQHVSFSSPAANEPIDVRYVSTGPDTFTVEVGEDLVEARYQPESPAIFELAGKITRPHITWTGDVAHVVTFDGAAELRMLPRFAHSQIDVDPGSLHSPMPGRILQVLTEEGAQVGQGDALIVMEAMKMEHTLRSPTAGTVASILVGVGDQVEGDAVLAIVHEA